MAEEIDIIKKELDVENKVLILASGGLDSTTLIYYYYSLGYKVTVLNILSDSKKGVRELVDIKIVCKLLQIDVISLQATKLDLAKDEDSKEIYIPSRNLIYLSIAVSQAEKLGIDNVAIGFTKAIEYYPDSSPEFFENYKFLIERMGTNIKILAPFMDLDKLEIARLGKKLGVKVKDIESCDISIKPCGQCMKCLELQAIKELL